MSKSNYQNLSEAYISNLREDFWDCVLQPCKNGRTSYKLENSKGWWDFIRPDCNTSSSYDCIDCVIGPWSDCNTNGKQYRTIKPPIGKGTCSVDLNATSQKCTPPPPIPCEYKENISTSCIYKDKLNFPCTPGEVYPGENTIDYIITKPAQNGGSCNLPAPKTVTCNNAIGCTAANVINYVLNDKTFSSDLRTNRFGKYLNTTVSKDGAFCYLLILYLNIIIYI